MALADITFVKGQGGLARTSPGQDHISGLVFYNDTLPSGFAADAREKQVFTIQEAESLGITVDTHPVEHYHIDEFFRANPGGALWIGIYEVPVGAHDYAEILDLQEAAQGSIRQIGVYSQVDFATSLVTALQTKLTQLANEHKPCVALLAANLATELASLDDLKSSNAPNVAVVIGQDGGGTGAALYASQGKSITCIGAALGAVSRAAVHENIGWVDKFNMSGSELDTLAFADGTAYANVSKTQLDGIDAKHYIFLQKHIGLNGSFFNGAWTADNGDYETIELNRTIDKAIRGIRTALLPFLNGPLYVNSNTGKLSVDTVGAYESEAERPLTTMSRNGELSGFNVSINPDQNVLSTSKLVVGVQLIPVGVSRAIEINIGFTVQTT